MELFRFSGHFEKPLVKRQTGGVTMVYKKRRIFNREFKVEAVMEVNGLGRKFGLAG